MIIRDLKPDDDVVGITAMLHRAYAPLAARGLRYSATHQSPEVTSKRLSRGHSFVAESDGRVVGIITAYGPNPDSKIPTYRDPLTFHFGQFGVDPDFKGNGIGRALHKASVSYALAQGAHFMALDTALPAKDLIATYERWGYVTVGYAQWDVTNYESVIMRCNIRKTSEQSTGPALSSAAKRSARHP